jgi:hypothetical protein
MNSHKNAPLTPKGREAMVRFVEAGLSKTAAARQLKRHAITSTMLNDIVQSVLDEVSDTAMARSGASGIAGN